MFCISVLTFAVFGHYVLWVCGCVLIPRKQCWSANVKVPKALLSEAREIFEKNPEGGHMITTGSVAVSIIRSSYPTQKLVLMKVLQGISQGGSSMPYAVTKAAQLQLVKCLAVTVGPKIRVNTVLPGLLLTEWVCYDFFSVPSLLHRFDSLFYSMLDFERYPSRRGWNFDMYTGPQIPSGAHPVHQRRSSAQTRSILGRLCRCIRHVGEEHKYDGHADPGGCWTERAGSVRSFVL
jgi:hypothetical protein